MSEIETFCGKPIDDMSREELVDAVKTLGRMLREEQDRALRHHDMQRRMREARQAFWNAELERLRRPLK